MFDVGSGEPQTLELVKPSYVGDVCVMGKDALKKPLRTTPVILVQYLFGSAEGTPDLVPEVFKVWQVSKNGTHQTDLQINIEAPPIILP